jgi:hypothetical protein
MNNAISRPLILAMGLVFPAAHIVMGLGNLHRLLSLWPALVAMAICLALMVLVTRPSKSREMPPRSAAVVIGGVLIMDLLVQSVLPVGMHPGYAAWHCGAIQMLIVTVALRKRIGAAWLGISLFTVLDMAGSILHGLTYLDAAVLVVTPLMWVAIAHAVNLGLTRCDELIGAYQKQEQLSAARLAEEHARWLSENEWLTELERATKPLLRKIAARTIAEAEKTNCFLLQQELRDQIRGRVLATPSVLRSASAARLRGVTVEIFDDRETGLSDALVSQATSHLVDVLDRTESGFVKARALPPGQKIAVTILAFDEAFPDQEFYLEINASAA